MDHFAAGHDDMELANRAISGAISLSLEHPALLRALVEPEIEYRTDPNVDRGPEEGPGVFADVFGHGLFARFCVSPR